MTAHDLAEYAVTHFPEGITLGEFKFLKSKSNFLFTRNDNVNRLSTTINSGFGIRFLINGAWGFAASHQLDKANIDVCIKQASKLAQAASKRNPNVTITEEPVVEEKITTKFEIDPFEVSNEEKIEYFISASKVAREYNEIKYANGLYFAQKDNLVFYNSEGTKIDQTLVWNGGYLNLIARGNGDTQTRKFSDDQFKTQGWELMKKLDLTANIDPVAKQLVQLLEAPTLKEQKSTIILNPSQVGIQLHESMGHPSELDRALGYEAAYAGTSFLKTELLNNDFNYGNELVSINADATIANGLGTFPYDHEGVAGKNTPLVKEGKFVGYLSSRETASLLGLENSGGSMRSISYEHIPLIRMTNIMLQPGDFTFDEMIQDTRDGYYFETNRSWSIDDIRLNFQFGCEVGYKIENGEITGLVKNPTYTGITPEFWGSVSAVGNAELSEVLGTPFCGKGEPGQSMFTGHGGPPAKFENIRIGIIN
ncbi:MAG: TldD/PmbA family protein [Candidatus Heimdallarchaeota archaeon]|nr:TldD/PmbA family protein [Candidatus Heimdallarchaeota archaeon]MDH5646022.1 TldD/PmbA family protein [Candidatus Heimdallarchaeota archaeon]